MPSVHCTSCTICIGVRSVLAVGFDCWKRSNTNTGASTLLQTCLYSCTATCAFATILVQLLNPLSTTATSLTGHNSCQSQPSSVSCYTVRLNKLNTAQGKPRVVSAAQRQLLATPDTALHSKAQAADDAAAAAVEAAAVQHGSNRAEQHQPTADRCCARLRLQPPLLQQATAAAAAVVAAAHRRRPRRPPFLRVLSVGMGVTSSAGHRQGRPQQPAQHTW